MAERSIRGDYLRAAIVCLAVCLALLAIKFEVFGWLGAAATILAILATICTSQTRIRKRLLIPAIILGGVAYSAASATVAAALL